MSLDTIRRIQPKTRAKSKKFFSDFRKELSMTISVLSESTEAVLKERFLVDSVIPKLNEIKIRIQGSDHSPDMIITIILRYHHDDEKYGHIHVEIVYSGLSEKPRSEFLGRYLITDRSAIVTDITHHLLQSLSEI